MAVGIICEYNPFHHGHLYHINEVKKKFPNSPIILILNGYFLERGEVSILSKRDKTELALAYGVNLVIELPFVFGSQSADVFAESALFLLNELGVEHLVFGSESNNLDALMDFAKKQLDDKNSERIHFYLKKGCNYPLALAKSYNCDIASPNDLLGISYCKAILKNHYLIQPSLILRTNDYHDELSNDAIISASNIRNKIKNEEDISNYLPQDVIAKIKTLDEKKLFAFFKYKILTDHDLSKYLTVDEGIESRLIKFITEADTLDEFIKLVKTKRYTYNKIRRMLLHILIGFTKKDRNMMKQEYLHILGFDEIGKQYLNENRKNKTIPWQVLFSAKMFQYEKIATLLYDELMNSNEISFEFINRPIEK